MRLVKLLYLAPLILLPIIPIAAYFDPFFAGYPKNTYILLPTYYLIQSTAEFVLLIVGFYAGVLVERRVSRGEEAVRKDLAR